MGLLNNRFGSMDWQVTFAAVLNLCDSRCFGRSFSVFSGEFWFFIPIGDGLRLLLASVTCTNFVFSFSLNLAAAMVLISVILRFSPCISVCSVITCLCFYLCYDWVYYGVQYSSIVVDVQSLVGSLLAISDASGGSFRSLFFPELNIVTNSTQ
jgi:hypothetical protein